MCYAIVGPKSGQGLSWRAWRISPPAQERANGNVLSQALLGRPPGGTILLSHTPWQAESAASAGAGLMLCGHTHGGQVWPFGYLISIMYPLLEGRYEVGGMPVIVCRGTGTWGPRMRLWRPSEILRVTLHGREKSYALSYNRTAFRASTGY